MFDFQELLILLVFEYCWFEFTMQFSAAVVAKYMTGFNPFY
jgi:hypothetical protein